MKIDIYTKPTCPYCVSTKHFLTERGHSFNEFILGENGVTKQNILDRLDGGDVRTVPQIFIDDEHIGGYSELIKWWK